MRHIPVKFQNIGLSNRPKIFWNWENKKIKNQSGLDFQTTILETRIQMNNSFRSLRKNYHKRCRKGIAELLSMLLVSGNLAVDSSLHWYKTFPKWSSCLTGLKLFLYNVVYVRCLPSSWESGILVCSRQRVSTWLAPSKSLGYWVSEELSWETVLSRSVARTMKHISCDSTQTRLSEAYMWFSLDFTPCNNKVVSYIGKEREGLRLI